MKSVALFSLITLVGCGVTSLEDSAFVRNYTRAFVDADCTVRGYGSSIESHGECHDLLWPYYNKEVVSARKEMRNVLIDFTDNAVPDCQPKCEDYVSEFPSEILVGRSAFGTNECLGFVIRGHCYGSVIVAGEQPLVCYGEWISGACSGASW